MSQKTSPVTLIIRIALILILVVLVGAFVVERRAAAAAAAKSAYDHAKEVVTSKQDSAALQQLLGRKPDLDDSSKFGMREQKYVYRGVVRDYTVHAFFTVQAQGEIAEEAYLNIFDKLKGAPVPSEDEGPVLK